MILNAKDAKGHGSEKRGTPIVKGQKLLSGTHVAFHSGEYEGHTGRITGQIPFETGAEARKYADNPTHRIQIEGFGKEYGKSGGWDGKVTATHENLREHATVIGDE
jgi:hypothetical protein